MTKRKRLFGRVACITLLVLVAFCVGTAVRPAAEARAGVREAAPTPHFLAGGERAVPVLEEISETLKRIDTRLSRIEKTVAEAAMRQDSR